MTAVIHRGIVLLGASGAGKTTLIAALHSALAQVDGISIPTRLTTRKARADDLDWENTSVSRAQLDDLEISGALLMRWQKRLSEDWVEDYAFGRQDGANLVLGANNALLLDPRNSEALLAIDGMVRILVTCRSELRLARLARRSPHILQDAKEWLARSEDGSSQLLSKVHCVIENNDEGIERCLVQIGHLMVGLGFELGNVFA